MKQHQLLRRLKLKRKKITMRLHVKMLGCVILCYLLARRYFLTFHQIPLSATNILQLLSYAVCQQLYVFQRRATRQQVHICFTRNRAVYTRTNAVQQRQTCCQVKTSQVNFIVKRPTVQTGKEKKSRKK